MACFILLAAVICCQVPTLLSSLPCRRDHRQSKTQGVGDLCYTCAFSSCIYACRAVSLHSISSGHFTHQPCSMSSPHYTTPRTPPSGLVTIKIPCSASFSKFAHMCKLVLILCRPPPTVCIMLNFIQQLSMQECSISMGIQ